MWGRSLARGRLVFGLAGFIRRMESGLELVEDGELLVIREVWPGHDLLQGAETSSAHVIVPQATDAHARGRDRVRLTRLHYHYCTSF